MIVFISDAENVEIVLKSKDCLNKPNSFYKIVRDAMQADGFFTLEGKMSLAEIFFLSKNVMFFFQKTYGEYTVVSLVQR